MKGLFKLIVSYIIIVIATLLVFLISILLVNKAIGQDIYSMSINHQYLTHSEGSTKNPICIRFLLEKETMYELEILVDSAKVQIGKTILYLGKTSSEKISLSVEKTQEIRVWVTPMNRTAKYIAALYYIKKI